MIHIEFNEVDGVAVIRPEQMHGLSEADFKALTDLVDHYLESHEALRGLVIVAKSFPGWEDFRAFISHIRFIRGHHRAIVKVALVSDSRLLSAAPYLVDHFVNARVRHFASADVEQAKAWVASEEARSGRFAILEGYPDNVVAIRAEGLITRDDYEETLIPLIEERIGARGRVKLLYWCGPEFEGFSAGAMWDDARIGLTHLGDFSKIAVVSDVGWVRQAAKLFAPFVRAPVQVFHNADIEQAKHWIIED
jgi:SpoIIAA-like